MVGYKYLGFTVHNKELLVWNKEKFNRELFDMKIVRVRKPHTNELLDMSQFKLGVDDNCIYVDYKNGYNPDDDVIVSVLAKCNVNDGDWYYGQGTQTRNINGNYYYQHDNRGGFALYRPTDALDAVQAWVREGLEKGSFTFEKNGYEIPYDEYVKAVGEYWYL